MRFRISNRADRDFGMVPRALWSMSLPSSAKLVAAYLFCLRDGAMPYVAEVEAATGLGRDARRRAFSLLIEAGLAEWHVERGGDGAIVGKTLELHTHRFQAPENQAHGQMGAGGHHAPENPAGGKHVDEGTEIRPSTDWKSGDTLKGKKRKSAERAREAAKQADRGRSSAGSGALSGLSGYQRTCLREGRDCLVHGVWLRNGSADHARLRAELRAAESEAGAQVRGVWS